MADRDTPNPIIVKPGAIGYKWPVIRPHRSGMVGTPTNLIHHGPPHHIRANQDR